MKVHLLFALCAILAGCETKSMKKYRRMMGEGKGPGLEALRALVREDPDFAQARIDLAEAFLAGNESDSASVHLNAAMEILERKRKNELREVDWSASFARAAVLEAEIRRKQFSGAVFGSTDELNECYDSLAAFVRMAASLVPALSGNDTIRSILDKPSFIKEHAVPFKLNTIWLLGLKETEVAEKLGDTRKIEGGETFLLAGKKVSYDHLLQSGACLIRNRSGSQEYTDCTLVMFAKGVCVAVRRIPGLRLVRKYAPPSIQSEDRLGDYLLVPLKDANLESSKVDFYPFVQWIVTAQTKGGYLVEFTTLESEAWNPTNRSREKNYVLDYFVAKN